MAETVTFHELWEMEGVVKQANGVVKTTPDPCSHDRQGGESQRRQGRDQFSIAYQVSG